MDGKEVQRTTCSLPVILLAYGSFPVMVLLSLILFEITEGGKNKFGIAIFGLLILIPLGALVSFSCSLFKRRQSSERVPWSGWLPRRMPVLSLLTLFVVAVITITLMALGDVLGFYGIIAAWVVLWTGISMALHGRRCTVHNG